MSVVVMGGCDWFQVLVSAVGIPGVVGSDAGCDRILGSGSGDGSGNWSGRSLSDLVVDVGSM